MKRLHASAGPARKHSCNRCHKHKRDVETLQKKSGARFSLCRQCRRELEKPRKRTRGLQ